MHMTWLLLRQLCQICNEFQPKRAVLTALELTLSRVLRVLQHNGRPTYLGARSLIREWGESGGPGVRSPDAAGEERSCEPRGAVVIRVACGCEILYDE
jgi:hypothetical protein